MLHPAFELHPEQNGGTDVPVKAGAKSACNHKFKEGPGYRFAGMSVAAGPRNGSLRRTGDYASVYTRGDDPKRGDPPGLFRERPILSKIMRKAGVI
jgi:hypothetical protein